VTFLSSPLGYLELPPPTFRFLHFLWRILRLTAFGLRTLLGSGQAQSLGTQLHAKSVQIPCQQFFKYIFDYSPFHFDCMDSECL
jgi:hypothetical protein